MRKYVILTLALFTLSSTIMAVPARRQWVTATMDDGSVIKVMLIGDEWGHYYTTENGDVVTKLADGKFAYADKKATLDSIAANKTRIHNANMQIKTMKAAKLAAMGIRKTVQQETDRSANYMNFRGAKKGIVILAQFADKSFDNSISAPYTFYSNMLNQEGYHVNNTPGSVHDYFKDASNDLFSLTFDVYGPVTVSKSATYYGGPNTSGFYQGVKYIGDFVTEVINLANNAYNINWQNYDWNADNEVDQIFILYAGYGSATGGPTGTIWPHESTLTSIKLSYYNGNGPITINGITIDTYACSNELDGNSGHVKMGMGTICHEFSHCMGLPDTYDISSSSSSTMGYWDLMDSGNYNDNIDSLKIRQLGWCPAGWTAWEKHFAGWLDYTELKENDSIKDMKPLLSGNQAYTIYNDNNRNEYYILQVNNTLSWDSGLPGHGLVAIHVDYDQSLFSSNIVNATGTSYGNDHQRMVLVRKKIGYDTYLESYPMVSGTLNIDSLTDYSTPSETLYNKNTDNTLLMHKPIYNIARDASTGYISFNYMPKATTAAISGITVQPSSDGICHIYNLNGQEVATTLDMDGVALPHGIYIFRKDGKSFKVKK